MTDSTHSDGSGTAGIRPQGEPSAAPGHTPGPWIVSPPWSGFSQIKSADGKLIFGLAAGRPHEKQHDAICEANARLIAAAPELLAAMQDTLAKYVQLANCGDCGFWDPETEAHVIAARAALAKATTAAQPPKPTP